MTELRAIRSIDLSTKQIDNIFKSLIKRAGIVNHGLFRWHTGRKLFLRTCAELGISSWSAKLMCGKVLRSIEIKKKYIERKRRTNRYTDMQWDDSSSDKWQLKRKTRLNNICDLLRKQRTTQYAEFVAKLAITSGIRSHIIRTYLDEIKTAGLITIKDNTIYWNNQSETSEPSRV